MSDVAYLLLWFVMTNGTGYIEPQRVEFAALTCGTAGSVVGIQVDRPVNPTRARFADPKAPDKHCSVDISKRVAGLAVGEYHLATTVVGADRKFGEVKPFDDYAGPDPHTAPMWTKQLGDPTPLPKRPTLFRIGGTP